MTQLEFNLAYASLDIMVLVAWLALLAPKVQNMGSTARWQGFNFRW
jgi:hypothetical protein